MQPSWQIPMMRKLNDARQGFRIYSQRLWFYPLLFLVTALVLYAVTTVLDRSLSFLVDSNSETTILFIFTGGPDAARSLLGSVATAWTTILGVVFSLTAVILQLASNKYTSELIPRIRRDVITQMTLSSLVGTVVYALMVLSTVRTSSGAGGDFVPYIGVTLALTFAGVSLLLTVTFIAHLSREIQADFLTSGLARDGISAMGRLQAPLGRSGVISVEPPGRVNGEALEFTATVGARVGYVQGVDWGPLVWALKKSLGQAPEGCRIRIDLERSADDHLYRGDRLGRVVLEGADGGSERMGEELAAWIRSVYELSRQRTVQRDVYYALEQLSDTGVKASQTGDVDVVRGCISGLTKLYAEISGARIPRAVQVREGGREAVVSLEYRPLREGTLRSLGRLVPRSLSMGYDSAVEGFFYDTAELIGRLSGNRENTSPDGSREQAERLAESLDLLLPALQGLYGQTAGAYGDSEVFSEGTRRWVTAVERAVEAGSISTESLAGFLAECRESAGDSPAAGIVAEGLRSLRDMAHREGDSELLSTLDAHGESTELLKESGPDS